MLLLVRGRVKRASRRHFLEQLVEQGTRHLSLMEQRSAGSKTTSGKKQALDLFTQQYASNIDVSSSLDIKKELFGKSCDDDHNAILLCYLVVKRGCFFWTA